MTTGGGPIVFRHFEAGLARAERPDAGGGTELTRRKIIGWFALPASLLAASLLLVQSNCPRMGAALTTGTRAFVRLKNRTELPRRKISTRG